MSKTTELSEATSDMLSENGIDISLIKNIEANCGTVYFDYEDDKYFVSVMKCEKTTADEYNITAQIGGDE